MFGRMLPCKVQDSSVGVRPLGLGGVGGAEAARSELRNTPTGLQATSGRAFAFGRAARLSWRAAPPAAPVEKKIRKVFGGGPPQSPLSTL